MNNYYVVKIPLINKNYFDFEINKKGKYKYRGTAYLIIEKGTGNVSFNTLLLDEDQDIYGADDGKYGDDYSIKRNEELFKYRQSSFDYSIPLGRSKKVSKFKHEISDLNRMILKHKLTIKSVDGFISGSNPSGGLKKPQGDPVRMFYGENDPLATIFNIESIKNIQWKFFSLLSNVAGKFNNSNFPFEITMDFINGLEEKGIEYIFNELDWKFIPYKEASSEEMYVDFKEAFKSQNAELFDIEKEDIATCATSNEYFKGMEYTNYILNLCDRGDKRKLSREVRSIWRRIVDFDIDMNEYEKDFVKGISIFERAHIIENRTAAEILLDPWLDVEEKKSYLKELFNSNNYILLTNDIHNAWDNKKISIEANGEIVNVSMNDDEFEILTRDHKNIFNIYPNVLNGERKRLLEERDHYI